MSYVRIDSTAGATYWDNSGGSLKIVTDPTTLQGLRSGSIKSKTQSSVSGGSDRFVNSTAPTTTQAPDTTTPAPAPTSTPSGFGLGGFQDVKKSEEAGVQFTPQSSSGGSDLLSFANALDSATNMAKQKRNALTLGVMMPSQGVTPASDFSGIVSRLNSASDTTAQNLTKRAIEAATPQYTTQQIGNEIFQMSYDASGRFTGAQKIAQVSESGGGFTYATATDNAGNLFEVQYDKDGKMVGQRLLSEALPTDKTSEGFTLGTNQVRFDSSGNKIASGPTDEGNDPASFKFSNEDRGLLTSSGFSSFEIDSIQNDVNQFGGTAVLNNINDQKQKAALQQVLTGEKDSEQFITEEYLRGLYGEDALKTAAKEAGYTAGGFLGIGVGEQGVQDYLDYLTNLVQMYRNAGYSDKEILKMIQA